MQTTVFTLWTPICKFEPVNLYEHEDKVGTCFINTLAIYIMANAANVLLKDKQCHPQLKCCLVMVWFINYNVIKKLNSNYLQKQNKFTEKVSEMQIRTCFFTLLL